MKPAIRTQADDLGDIYSLTTSTENDEPSMARQEFADEANINILLRRYGVNIPAREPIWGQEVDFDLDLTKAYEVVNELKDAWPTLPDHITRQYGTWPELLEALYSGAVTLKPEETPEPEPPDPAPEA